MCISNTFNARRVVAIEKFSWSRGSIGTRLAAIAAHRHIRYFLSYLHGKYDFECNLLIIFHFRITISHFFLRLSRRDGLLFFICYAHAARAEALTNTTPYPIPPLPPSCSELQYRRDWQVGMSGKCVIVFIFIYFKLIQQEKKKFCLVNFSYNV